MTSAPAAAKHTRSWLIGYVRRKVHYGWVVFGVTWMALVTVAGIRATPALLIGPFEAEFGWSRVSVSGGISLSLFLNGMLGPFSAAAVNRYGARAIMAAALSLMALAIGLSLGQRTPWEFVLYWGGIVGACSGVTANVLGIHVVHRWFARPAVANGSIGTAAIP